MAQSIRSQLKFLARIHFLVLGLSLVGYGALLFVLGPRFLAFDVSQKIQALADEIIVVTAVVLGPPATPVVTATPTCVNGNPRIVLDWANDAATTTWDIERDSAPLTTGLTASTYTDTAVVGNGVYSYVVTALGPMSPGIATSVPVTATAIDCSTLLPPATVTITSLGAKVVVPPRSFPITIDETRPRIKGNTNVISAIVDITLTRPTQITRTVANANGYFSWKLPRSLHSGTHTVTVTVTDPNDSSRTETETLTFSTELGRRSTSHRLEDIPIETTVTTRPSFDFSLTLVSPQPSVRQGERLRLMIQALRGAFPAGTVLAPTLVDAKGETVFVAPSRTTPQGANVEQVEWLLDIPVYLPAGTYRVQVEALMGEVSLSRSAPFVLTERPLIAIGGRTVATYAEVASFLGWILFGGATILIVFFLFLVREYGLYLEHVRHVTERELRRWGMIGERKGVAKR